MALLPVSFRWSGEFVARVDAARGDVPRSRFVREALEAVMGAPAAARARPVSTRAPRGCRLVGVPRHLLLDAPEPVPVPGQLELAS